MNIHFQVSSKIVECPETLRAFLSAVKTTFPDRLPVMAMAPPSMPAAPKDEQHGPAVSEYLSTTGQARFRMTNEERARFGDDREAAALERLDAARETPAPSMPVVINEGEGF